MSSSSWLSCLALLLTHAFAQSDCQGDTTSYDQNGLVVPFTNLCGKDISAAVDFPGASNEPTRADCLNRCVEKVPLCFGFDYGTPGDAYINCWLMNASFPESSAVATNNIADAAMLAPELVASLSSDCRLLGLWGCYQKNGQLEPESTTQSSTVTSSSSAASTSSATSATSASTTASTTPTPVSMAAPANNGGLSAGAKAGIGAGVGGVVLLVGIVGAFFLLKRRKQGARHVDSTAIPVLPPPYAPEKRVASVQPYQIAPAELQGQDGPYRTPELPNPSFSPIQK